MLAVLAVAAALAQQGHDHPGAPPASAAILEVAQRAPLARAGIGEAHDAVGTTARQAQLLYDRGLAYLHSYWWLEAARCFNAALRVDPKLAIAAAQLSLVYTELNAPDAAKAALARAQSLAAEATDHDRRHVAMRAAQMAAEVAGTWAADAQQAFRTALDAASARYPADQEFQLLRGLAESPDPAERGQGSVAASIPFFQKALVAAPGQVAAHHYLTHAFENTGRINEALAEGASYAKMAPNVPHARHMHGHNLRRVGRVDEAIAEFEAADALESSYFAGEGIPAEYDWHYQHNVDLLATSYQYIGQMRKAEVLLKRSFAIASPLLVQEFNKREWPMFLLARGRAGEALEAAMVMAAHRSPVVSATGHVMAGHARLALGDFKAAADEANAALRLMRGSPIGAGLVANALQAVQGEFLLRTGQRDKARPMLEDVVRKVRAAPGPDAWSQALFTIESIARAAREVEDWDLAGWAAGQMIDHDPHYAGSQYALALAAGHRGDRAAADAAMMLAKDYWKHADADAALR
jgi:tetratricopeptide (TPR) repeat protein